jgi:hypothetical protein
MTTAPYFNFACSRCCQCCIPGETIRDMPSDAPLVCEACRSAEREPQGESMRLFTPATTQLDGQLSF